METKPAIKEFEAIKMPELPVFARFLAIGFVSAEVFRAAFYLGANFIQKLPGMPDWVRAGVVLVVLLVCLHYCIMRGAHIVAARMARSSRVDLLVVIGVGIWANELAAPWLIGFHALLVKANPLWAPAVLLLLCFVLASPMMRRSGSRRTPPLPYFLPDEEIRDEIDDVLASKAQAALFAQTVLASGAHSGLVFGVDGPWGVGKTSFLNLAARHWEQAGDRVIVCRFEPLRYASEPDLADRLIRDMSAAIQRKVFAPEFRPAVSRYARLIRGKADFSFLGFKLSLEPSQETIEDLLDDIDDVLRRIDRRVIVVIDDLDRLDLKTANSLLFATRRTFSLSQATYVLCYDTEVLAGSSEEGTRAREFLEKFVTIKLSLFVDSSSLGEFLLRDWQQADTFGSIPADTMFKLATVLSELAGILDGDLAAEYRSVLGDLRKVKRFVNAMLMMQMEKTELGRTDFNKRDLIHLMLLHLNYPGVFRRIYAEETEGRSGVFSVRRRPNEVGFVNDDGFSKLLEELGESNQKTARFLLQQLFDAKSLNLVGRNDLDEAELRSRACFNNDRSRNLEGYLKLIVRLAVPPLQDTYVLYQQAVQQIEKGESVSAILMSSAFRLEKGERVHDQFWSVLATQCRTFPRKAADDAIDTLVDYLPHYSAVGTYDRSLRQRSIYSLLQLLDRAGWGDSAGRRWKTRPEYIVEIAQRIFGAQSYMGKGLLERLAASDRGALGWNDLVLFRLQCSEDRQGQLYNLYRALIVDQDSKAPTDGVVSGLARMGMRKLSQEVFALFKKTYIDPQRNFYADVDGTQAVEFFGTALPQSDPQDSVGGQSVTGVPSSDQKVSATRSSVKSFVIYQLCNSRPSSQEGVGCGYYDESGEGDQGGIASQMNRYVFGVCFNPDFNVDNVFHFVDHCLTHLSNPIFSGVDEDRYTATKAGLPGSLDPAEMGRYWRRHQELIRQLIRDNEDRHVVTLHYDISYREDLTGVFKVLDELADEAELSC
ncbi:KAP P-loop protein [Burkholderia cenocepacia]|uniref:P-loop NTPase fold protein n=1 Tax=Burkholderia cenocepacia TaxID=95486 RepID=UPI001B994FE6|nr:P-loop NTPase fold protein [Burkholderia cenocepacia]MBR8069296.1 KAP P-loop protein [Burkholderia cenocepacia]MBR8444364.1 KAP P-loop protein [Burkholderia cenocepacia]